MSTDMNMRLYPLFDEDEY